MIARAAVGAPLAVVTAAAVEPTRWPLLGYSVEAAPLVGGLIACVCVRAWISLSAEKHRWTIEAPVLILSALLTAAAVAVIHANPLTGILVGTGFAATGAKIIDRAKRLVDRLLPDEPSDPDPDGKDQA